MAGPILVIEDDHTVLEMMTDILKSSGYQVIGLAYPDLVLEVVSHERPDLILMDIMLPARSGIEVADQLWINGFGTIPIIALSASSVMTDLARQAPFFQRVLRKPFALEELLSSVADVVSDHLPASAAVEVGSGV